MNRLPALARTREFSSPLSVICRFESLGTPEHRDAIQLVSEGRTESLEAEQKPRDANSASGVLRQSVCFAPRTRHSNSDVRYSVDYVRFTPKCRRFGRVFRMSVIDPRPTLPTRTAKLSRSICKTSKFCIVPAICEHSLVCECEKEIRKADTAISDW